MLLSFAHAREIDGMPPGAAPTGKIVEVPLVAIFRFRGDKLAHEHIYRDQASPEGALTTRSVECPAPSRKPTGSSTWRGSNGRVPLFAMVEDYAGFSGASEGLAVRADRPKLNSIQAGIGHGRRQNQHARTIDPCG